MADIAMCTNRQCQSFSDCYRAQAKANPHRQTYMDFKPKEGADKCADFWEIYNPINPLNSGEQE